MILTRPMISKSSSLFILPLVTVPRASITIDITLTFMFHIFFQFCGNIPLLAFFQFYSVVSRDSNVPIWAGSLFLVDYYEV